MSKIFYGDSVLFFMGEESFPSPDGVVLHSGESFANIVENLERYKQVTVAADDPDNETQRFMENFRHVDAAGGLVSNPAGELLMIYRNGRWDLPKGHREAGEDTRTCAVREVGEETGIAVCAGTEWPLAAETLHFYPLRGEWVMKHTYWYAMQAGEGGDTTPQTAEGITAAEWISRAEMPVKAATCFPSVREVLYAGRWLE